MRARATQSKPLAEKITLTGPRCFNMPTVTLPDVVPELLTRMPKLRGRLMPNQSLAELTWFRVGGPAQVLFMPEDESDLAYFLSALPAEIPVTVIGLGSNLIVRDGGGTGRCCPSRPRLRRGQSRSGIPHSLRRRGP